MSDARRAEREASAKQEVGLRAQHLSFLDSAANPSLVARISKIRRNMHVKHNDVDLSCRNLADANLHADDVRRGRTRPGSKAQRDSTDALEN